MIVQLILLSENKISKRFSNLFKENNYIIIIYKSYLKHI